MSTEISLEGLNKASVLSWENVSKIPTTLFAIVAHIGIGIYRLIMTLILAIKLIPFAIKIAASFVWAMFSAQYQKTWNSIYAKIASPVCEVCGETKAKGHSVKFVDICDQWASYDCLIAREVACELNNDNDKQAAIHIAMCRLNERPLALKVTIQCLRDMRSPYKQNLYKDLARAKRLSKEMGPFEVALNLIGAF